MERFVKRNAIENTKGGAWLPRLRSKSTYAAGIIFFIRSAISEGDTSST